MRPALRHWFLLVVGTVGMVGSLVTAQMILTRHDWRIDLTPDRRYALSDYSKRVLDALDRDVRVIAFLRSDDPRNRDIEDLLRRVSLASDRVHCRTVDLNRNPALAREYGIDAFGAIVVESGERRRRFSIPTEDFLVAALVQVTYPTVRRVYFMTGHGERNLRSTRQKQGFSSAAAALMTERYGVGELPLLNRPVPSDAAAIVLAGPRRNLATDELLRLGDYLEGGGGVLVLLDPGGAPDLVTWLRRYGVAADDDIVLDRENRLFAGDDLTMLIPLRSPDNPISAALAAPPLFSAARAVRLDISGTTVVSGTELLRTAPESWGTSDPTVLRTGEGHYVEGRDTRGPLSVGVAVVVRGAGPTPGRLVVLGDADFASNGFLGYLGNRDLLLNSVHWLAREPLLIGSRRPRQKPGVNQFFVSERQGRRAFWVGTVAEPLLVLLVGMFVVLRRRLSG